MSRAATLQNFRGARALLAHPADQNRDTLEATLRRLGLDVAILDPTALEPGAAETPPCDVAFFDADEGLGAALGEARPEVPLVAVIGTEAPSRLLRVVRQRCASHLMKPVRPSGVFTALFLAMNEHATRRREAEARAALSARLHGRREVIKAVLALMERHAVDDDEAYRLLRIESMRRRLSVERYAADLMAAPDPDGEARLAAPARRINGTTTDRR